MHSTIYTPSNQFVLPWKSSQIPHLKSPSKTLTPTNALRTHISYELEVGVGDTAATPSPLPVVVRQSGKASRYFWEGSCLKLVDVDGEGQQQSLLSGNGVPKLCETCGVAVRNFFLPKHVTQNYISYVKWKFLHRVFSSALQVLATQAMLRAIGIGSARSLQSAAALNWVLKDGLGRLSRCIYTASLASAFDTNLKRVQFSTAVLFSLSIGVELLTPIYPLNFLLLASIANAVKQISLACSLATSSAVHRSFAIADNLGEVSAKAQIQSVCFDNLGLVLATFLNILCNNNQRMLAGLPFIVYPIFTAFDLLGIYQGLKHVVLQTLTKDRLEIILETWIQKGYVPSPEEVSKQEGIDFMWIKDKKLWPIRIGCLNPRYQLPNLSKRVMQSVCENDHYFISMEIRRGLLRKNQLGIILCIHEGALPEHVLMGFLQACYMRNFLLTESQWEGIVNASDYSDSALSKSFELIKRSKQFAESEFELLNDQIQAQGWMTKNLLFNANEQARYAYCHD